MLNKTAACRRGYHIYQHKAFFQTRGRTAINGRALAGVSIVDVNQFSDKFACTLDPPLDEGQ